MSRILLLTGCSVLSGIYLAACKQAEPPPAAEYDCPKYVTGDLSAHQIGGQAAGESPWPFWGGDLANRHYAESESILSPENINQLVLAWSFQTTGSVSTNPTVSGDGLFFPDWGPALGGVSEGLPGGQFYAIDRHNGALKWQRSIRSYNDNDFNNISRNSPAVAEDLLVFGDVQNAVPMVSNGLWLDAKARKDSGLDQPCGAYLYAVNSGVANPEQAGKLVWKTRVGTELYDQITQSPTVAKDKVFVGVSSQESAYAKAGNLNCCSFKGSFVALDLHTGKEIWRTPMTISRPDDQGVEQFSGAAVWAGAPTIDLKRNSVYVPTGNNYWVPQSYRQCVLQAADDVEAMQACSDIWEDNYFDAIVALDLDSGAVKWAMRALPYDAWTVACDIDGSIPLLKAVSSTKWCPDPVGPDADFAQPPMLISVDLGDGVKEERLFAGNKAGVFFAINPDNGEVIWKKQVGPGGTIGGMEFGAASDGRRIYLQNSNYNHIPYTLEAGLRKGEETRGGFWAALDPLNGEILWQTPVPTADLPFADVCNLDGIAKWGPSVCLHPVQGANKGPAWWAWPVGPLTVANGLVFAGVSDLNGTMVAMDASSGQILWQYQSGASIASAPTIVDGQLYWGIGYKYGVEGNALLSFKLPDAEPR